MGPQTTTTPTSPPLFVDSDNALGSRLGDIDDGFALSALLSSDYPIAALASIFGNTSSINAFLNTYELTKSINWKGPVILGAQGHSHWEADLENQFKTPQVPWRWLALGPLTNVYHLALKKRLTQLSELIIVGSNTTSKGFIPPYWPMEFNLAKDKMASYWVLKNIRPLTIIPLNQARRMEVSLQQISKLKGPLASQLFKKSKRWALRNRLLKGRASFPLWDLVAAIYITHPHLFKFHYCGLQFKKERIVDFIPTTSDSMEGGESVKVLVDYCPNQVWEVFAHTLASTSQ